MVDPVGAPTFAQLFSPTKSPFHAVSLFSLICIYVSILNPLFSYVFGLTVLVLVTSLILSPLFRPSYDNRSYGLSLMYGRAAGIVGGLIAITLLISGSVETHYAAAQGGLGIDQENLKKFAADTLIFRFLWIAVVMHSMFWLATLGLKTKRIVKKGKAFNILQFSLIQSTMLIFIVALATKIGYIDVNYDWDKLAESIQYILLAPMAIFSGVYIEPIQTLFCIFTMWLGFSVINIVLLFSKVQIGWIGDHGDGDVS